MLAGPYCGMMLADLGAEVIKVEAPDGDIGRTVSPHFVGQHNAYFASLNRSKKSVVLDLSSQHGRDALGRIVSHSHALVTNLRPSAIRKLGLTYESLRCWNEQLVCVALTGYGLDGPYSENPAYDYVIQAMTGVMSLTGEPDGKPTKAGYSAVDNSAGLVAALGLLAKVIHGKGGQVDVAMYDVMLSQLNYLAGAVLNAGEKIEGTADSSHPYVVPAQIFPTKNGWLTLFITHDKFWKIFCEEVEQTDWITAPKFATMAARRENRSLVLPAIAAVLKHATAKEWVLRLQPKGIVVSEIETLNQSIVGDITKARSLVIALGDGSANLRAIASPIRFDGVDTKYGMPPLLGEHTNEILGRNQS